MPTVMEDSSANFRFLAENFDQELTDDDSCVTHSYLEQAKVEASVGACYKDFKLRLEKEGKSGIPSLERSQHGAFLVKGLKNLSESYEVLDASQPWICYWILHSLELLDIPISEEQAENVAIFLGKCQCPEGGFGGGPGQQPHLAPTYAAVNALCILGTLTDTAYKVINREKLHAFIMSRRTAEGAFTMHEGGEEDIRGAYCAASVARLTNIMTPDMFEGTAEWIVRCQTYEGGFAGCPGMEAHGGYSFCGFAALVILGRERLCDIDRLLYWTANRQMSFEGGFQGRTNKLVDGCYSFWQGGVFPLIHTVLSKQGDCCLSVEKWLFHQAALQEYVLICCQHESGGLLDKPGKPRDFYHTCYCLSGLSVAQHFVQGHIAAENIVGNPKNELKPTHPVFNIGYEATAAAAQYFSSMQNVAHKQQKS